MPKLTGSEIVVGLLERQGIRIVSGIPGGANLPLYDALSRSGTIRHVLARHEQGAGFIAQGMARVTGTPQVAIATSGPGATNLLTAVADARLDSIPLVCLTGQVPTSMIGTDAFQEVDTYGMTVPVTKHNFLVRRADELLEAIPEAFRLAASGRPGPVVVDLPKDVQLAPVSFDRWPDPGRPDPPAAPDRSALASAARLVDAARRPVLYLGGGAIASGAGEAALALAGKCGMAVTTTLLGLGSIPFDHPRNLGMLGMHGPRCANLALAECDLLVVAGARFDDRATGKVSAFCPGAAVVHIDVDPGEIGKIRQASAGVVGDARLALEGLLPLVAAAERREWLDRLAELKGAFPLRMAGADDPTTPYGLLRAAAEILGPDAIVATDVGRHQMWAAQAWPHRKPRRWLTSGGLGTMGFGLPAAIGAALAAPDAPVACVTGDGSLLMNLQELATAAEEGTAVKLLLMNNNSLGMVRQQQELLYGNRIFASDYRVRVDFPAVARALGVAAYDLAGSPDPRALLEEALRAPGAALVHVPVDALENVFPMVPPGAANTDMLVSKEEEEDGNDATCA
jgi:acetolactate synthase-1/2/3 large subunit